MWVSVREAGFFRHSFLLGGKGVESDGLAHEPKSAAGSTAKEVVVRAVYVVGMPAGAVDIHTDVGSLPLNPGVGALEFVDGCEAEE